MHLAGFFRLTPAHSPVYRFPCRRSPLTPRNSARPQRLTHNRRQEGSYINTILRSAGFPAIALLLAPQTDKNNTGPKPEPPAFPAPSLSLIALLDQLVDAGKIVFKPAKNAKPFTFTDGTDAGTVQTRLADAIITDELGAIVNGCGIVKRTPPATSGKASEVIFQWPRFAINPKVKVPVFDTRESDKAHAALDALTTKIVRRYLEHRAAMKKAGQTLNQPVTSHTPGAVMLTPEQAAELDL